MDYQLNNKKMQLMSIIKEKAFGYKFLLIALIAFSSMISFNSKAETGKELFDNQCSACHSITDQVKLGPGLGGLNDRRSEEWSIQWIRNSQEMIDAGDEQALAIFKEFKNMPMTPFPNLSDEDIQGILAYIAAEGSAGGDDGGGAIASTGGAATTSDGGDDSTGSGINSTIIIWGIIILLIGIYFTRRFTKKVKQNVEQMGFHPEAHRVKNYPAIFLMYIAIALGLVYLVANLLDNGQGMINEFMFVILPYASFAIFFMGSIYRYTQKSYKVTSLSSQFIEGKQLFWGSQPFHWGLMILFFGHLIAFLFPSTLTMWNGVPLRRLILEIASFAFGLSALLGLVLLIIRRLRNKSLLVVTNKMDMVVYTVLFTQIISGLGVAFYVRWGSEWFASVLTPYLRSIFSFSPDITAVQEMPLWIQIHIISAFLIIGIIPFTRFMHFLVAPVDYIWRKYQVVVWNWNRKNIRNSRQHTYGKKTRNH